MPVLMRQSKFVLLASTLASALTLVSCKPLSPGSTPSVSHAMLRDSVKTIVVIYAENRSFDNLFGKFPGANGIASVLAADGKPTSAYIPQKDRDGRTILPTLPPTWYGVTQTGIKPVVTQAQSAGLANAPFAIETAFQASANATLSTSTVTRDLWHRFYENQMQIDGGNNDGFAAWSDAGGLTMADFDYSNSAMFRLAREYELADNIFQGAFGGSFLNHQYLICACAPEYPNAAAAPARPSITLLKKDPSGSTCPYSSPPRTIRPPRSTAHRCSRTAATSRPRIISVTGSSMP